MRWFWFSLAAALAAGMLFAWRQDQGVRPPDKLHSWKSHLGLLAGVGFLVYMGLTE